MQYLVVIEKGESSYGATVPDLPGCTAVGETRAETSRLIHEAIEFDVAGLLEDGSLFRRQPVRLKCWMWLHDGSSPTSTTQPLL